MIFFWKTQFLTNFDDDKFKEETFSYVICQDNYVGLSLFCNVFGHVCEENNFKLQNVQHF